MMRFLLTKPAILHPVGRLPVVKHPLMIATDTFGVGSMIMLSVIQCLCALPFPSVDARFFCDHTYVL